MRKSASCKSGETTLDWNRTGPAGEQGPPGPTQGVGSQPVGGATPPTSLTDQFGFGATSESEFTTTVSGKLHLTKPFSGYLDCPSAGSVWWWITLDGTPVSSSIALAQAQTSPTFYTLVGVTDTAIAAGTHKMRIEGMCFSGAGGASGINTYSAGTAIVLG